jgi:hypothetical protein
LDQDPWLRREGTAEDERRVTVPVEVLPDGTSKFVDVNSLTRVANPEKLFGKLASFSFSFGGITLESEYQFSSFVLVFCFGDVKQLEQ